MIRFFNRVPIQVSWHHEGLAEEWHRSGWHVPIMVMRHDRSRHCEAFRIIQGHYRKRLIFGSCLFTWNLNNAPAGATKSWPASSERHSPQDSTLLHCWQLQLQSTLAMATFQRIKADRVQNLPQFVLGAWCNEKHRNIPPGTMVPRTGCCFTSSFLISESAGASDLDSDTRQCWCAAATGLETQRNQAA